MRYIIWIFILLLLHSTNLPAQQSEGNPFDIKARATTPKIQQATQSTTSNPFDIKESASSDSPSAISPTTQQSSSTSANPFDMERGAASSSHRPPLPSAELAQTDDLPARPRDDSNFLFWTILCMLFLLTLLFSLYRSVIIKSYRAFTNDNFLKLIHRDQGAIVSGPYMLLYFSFFINAGIFLMLLWRRLGWIETGTFSLLVLFVGGVAGIFALKHLMLKVIEYAFPVSKEVKQYSFMIIIFSIILGLFLVPVNVMVAYSPSSFINGVIYVAVGVIILVYLFRTFRSLFLASKYITFHKFHFFMYLCTVEIAPALVLSKLLLMKAGIQ